MNIHERLKEIRKQKGISQKQVADFAGLSVAAYSNIESGISKSITIESGKGIAKALEIPFNELFEIEITGIVTGGDSGELDQLRVKINELAKRIEEKDISIKELQNEILIKNNELIEEIAFLYNYVESLFGQLIKLAENENDRKRDSAVKHLLQGYIYSTIGKVPNSEIIFKRYNDHWKHINEIENFDLNEYVNQ